MEFGHFSYPNLGFSDFDRKTIKIEIWRPAKNQYFLITNPFEKFQFPACRRGGPFQASYDQFSWSWIELKRNRIELNWKFIELKLNWNVVNWNWNWTEVNRIDLKLNWFVEMKSSWYRHELIRIDVEFDFGFNWIELKFNSIEAGWNWV